MLYLPEYHEFKYIARCNWPRPQPQMDWIDAVLTLEHWLKEYVGPHYQRWAWTTEQAQTTYEACVAFKWEKHKTLFLLRWSE